MTRPLLVLLTVLFFLSSGRLFAGQTPPKDTSAAAASIAPSDGKNTPSPASAASTAVPPDDDFNLFLLLLGTAFVSVILGAVVVGSFAATLFLLFLFGLVSAGILTTSVMVGLYKRSISAGFRTLSIIVCSLGGIAAGSLAMLFVNGLFKLKLSHPAAIASGAAAGLIGGLLLGLSISFLFLFFTDYFRKKLAATA